MRIQVTKEDVAAGLPVDAFSCPVALALRRAFPRLDVGVGHNTLHVGRSRLILPPRAQRFVGNFDMTMPWPWVRPFSFDLDLLPESVREEQEQPVRSVRQASLALT